MRPISRRRLIQAGAMAAPAAALAGGHAAASGTRLAETVSVGEYTAEFRIPERDDAYEQLEIEYVVRAPRGHAPVTVSANAFEAGDETFFDSLAPGTMTASIEYLGGQSGAGEIGPFGPVVLTSRFDNTFRRHHIRVTNTGDTIWKALGLGMVSARLVVLDSNGTTIDVGTETMQVLAQNVAPSGELDLSVVYAPMSPGGYTLRFTLNLHNDTSLNHFDPGMVFASLDVPVTVVPGELSLQSMSLPDKLQTGQSMPVSLTYKNLSTQTWTLAALDRLGSEGANAFPWSDLNGGYSNGLDAQRVFLDPADAIAPGQEVTFDFTITAPSTPGSHVFAAAIVRDGVAWYPNTSARKTIEVTAEPQPTDPPAPSEPTPIDSDPEWPGNTSVGGDAPPRVPQVLDRYEEFLAAYQVLENERVYRGVLAVQVPAWDTQVTAKLSTPDGVVTVKRTVSVSTSRLRRDVQRAKQRVLRSAAADYGPASGDVPLLAWYYPYRAVRFAGDPDQQIRDDLRTMKELGYSAVWLQLFPQFVPAETTPTIRCLELAREVGIKVIPSLYFTNQGPALTARTGIELTRGGDGAAAGYVDPLDLRLGDAMAEWYRQLEESWGDLFYRTSSGSVPVGIGEEASTGVWTRRLAGYSPEDNAAFREWLIERHGRLDAVNQAWGASYAAIEEIDPQLSNVEPQDYPAGWEEGSVALSDHDAFRSLLLARQLGAVSGAIKQLRPEAKVGVVYFANFGLEGTSDSNYYGLSDGNWLAARCGQIEQYCADAETTGLDWIAPLYSSGDTDWEELAARTAQHGIVPIMYPEFNGMNFIQGKGTSALWDFSWGWYELDGVEARDLRQLSAVIPAMLQSMSGGGLPGAYSWNDHPLFTRMTEVQQREISLMASLL